MTRFAPGLIAAFRSPGMRTFGTIWIGQLISLIGSGLTSFALGVWIYEQTGSATQFAINLLVYFLPTILVSPIAGVVADRYDRRLVLIGADMLAGVSTITMLVLYATNVLQPWHIYVATFLNATANTFQWPAYGAAVTMLVPKEHLGRASGMTNAAQAIAELLAPGIAGMLYVAIRLNAIFVVDLATFAFSILTLALVRIPHPERTVHPDHGGGLRGFYKEATYGWHYLRQRPGLLGLLTVFALCNFMFTLSHPLLPTMLLDMTTPDQYGLAMSIAGTGMIGGTLLMSLWGGFKRRIVGVAISDMAIGLLDALVGLARTLPLMTAGIWGIMFVFPINAGSSQSLWQSKVAADVQGRVFAVRRMIAFSIIPVATALSGPLADTIFKPALMPGGALANTFVAQVIGVGPGRGIGLMMVISGLIYTALSTVHLIHPRIRRVEIELPDAVTAPAAEALPDTPSEAPLEPAPAR